MDEMFAIKCQNCGGPMYSHQAKRSFECAYCGAVIPWQADAGEPKSALGIRHTPLTVVDGLLKLTHVSQLERPEDPDWYFFNSYWRNQSVLEHLLWEDRGTARPLRGHRPSACLSARPAAIRSALSTCLNPAPSASV